MYIKLPNIYPYSFAKLKAEHPDVSFPAVMPDERLADWGVYPVVKTSPPTVQSNQVAEEAAPSLVDGAWLQQWTVRSFTADETNQYGLDVRAQRTQLLSESDWTQVADAPVDKAAWAAYRQQLRDIPLQAGFPFNVVWPAKP